MRGWAYKQQHSHTRGYPFQAHHSDFFARGLSIIGRQGVQDPICHLQYQWALVADVSSPPGAVLIGIIYCLRALHNQLGKMAIVWAQVIILHWEFL